ncbi:unnamed protein product, partial [marine sediment metagenome]
EFALLTKAKVYIIKGRFKMKDWKKDLSDIFNKIEEEKQDKEKRIKEKKSEVESFYLLKVTLAFEELKTELEKHGRRVEVYSTEEYASITVEFKGIEECSYAIKVRVSPDRAFPYREHRYTNKKDGKVYESTHGFIRGGSQGYNISDISKEEIRQDFLFLYTFWALPYD